MQISNQRTYRSGDIFQTIMKRILSIEKFWMTYIQVTHIIRYVNELKIIKNV